MKILGPEGVGGEDLGSEGVAGRAGGHRRWLLAEQVDITGGLVGVLHALGSEKRKVIRNYVSFE